jgi:hypothetical protein
LENCVRDAWLDDKILVGLRIKCPLTPSISPGYYSPTVRGGPPTWYQSQSLGFNPLSHAFSAAQIIPPSLIRSPYDGALLCMHMARVRGHGLHTVERILDLE